MKTGILLAFLVGCGLSATAQKPPKPSAKPRLHVLYVLEQEDPAIGLLNLGNEELMTQIAQTVAWGLGDSLPPMIYLTKKDFTQAALNRTLTNLKTQPNDIIILYYSGFGVVPTQSTVNFSSWKLRDTPAQGLAVGEVEKWLMAKNVHLRLLIADCTAQRLTNNEPTVAADLAVSEDLRQKVIQRLFLNTCGLVKMGSSLPLLPSWTVMNGAGSAFTKSLSGAFEVLLLTATTADLSTVSFERLNAFTQSQLSLTIQNKPFRQMPVLEIKSCRRTAQPIVQSVSVDPLADETLNNLLNGVAFSVDSLRSIPIRNKLLGLSQPDATVEVSRYFIPGCNWQADAPPPFPGQGIPDSDTSPGWQEDPKFHKTYSLKAYLDQIQKPLRYVEGDSVRLFPGNYRKIFVTDKVVDKSSPKPIKRLVIRENWK